MLGRDLYGWYDCDPISMVMKTAQQKQIDAKTD